MAPGHPESPARTRAIETRLREEGILARLESHEAPLASPAELAAVHDSAHVAEIFERAPESGLVSLDPDTFMNNGSLEAALRAAGAATLAVDLVLAGTVRNAFCNVRPPGHHAERDKAMGFCFFNNVAVAAARALSAGLERVAILDFDVHHGNGTEDIFRDDPRVLLCSTFQHPLYPFSAGASISQRLVNVPLAAGTGSEVFREAVQARWLPELERYRPELVIVSAGFDAHVADPLAGLMLVDDDYAWVTTQIVDLADRHAGGRIVSALEGGYELGALARCASLHVHGLLAA